MRDPPSPRSRPAPLPQADPLLAGRRCAAEGPPTGPFPGARWKTLLAFRPSGSAPPLHLFVFDAAKCRTMDSEKYSVRAAMADAVGAPGNCCLHLTDE